MGKRGAVRIAPRLSPVLGDLRRCQHIAVTVDNISPHDPLRKRILPLIVRTVHHGSRPDDSEIDKVCHKSDKKYHKKIRNSSELFVLHALFAFGASSVSGLPRISVYSLPRSFWSSFPIHLLTPFLSFSLS